jgi:hypothetical protein
MANALAIILGASNWPRYPAFDASAVFANSANFFREYLLSEDGLQLSPDNILWLLDEDDRPGDIIDRMQAFLRTKTNADTSISDILVYYVGHGAYVNDAYVVATHCTAQSNIELTTLPVRLIAKTLYEETPGIRHLVILDACYASGAVSEFMYQGDPVTVVREQIREALPEKDITTGTALFCAAGPKSPAKAPWEGMYTMFSGALQRVLTKGDLSVQEELLSLEELARLVYEDILNEFRNQQVRPQLHTPRQEDGDIRVLRLFPNVARRQSLPNVRWRTLDNAVQDLREQVRAQTVALDAIRSKLDILTGNIPDKHLEEAKKDIRERMRLLFQNNSLPDQVVTYFMNESLRVGTYAERADWRIYIEEYRPDLQAYNVRAQTEYHYVNMFSDHPVNVQLSYGYDPANDFPDLPKEYVVGRYFQLKVGDEDRLQDRGPLTITNKRMEQKLNVQIEPLGRIAFRTEYVCLRKIGEPQRMRPHRFLALLTVAITNRLDVPITRIRNEAGQEIDLFFGREYPVNPIQGVSPGEVAFSFVLLPPVK